MNFETFKSGLTDEMKKPLIKHFDEIYICDKLDDRELKMTYLAYLWKNGRVVTSPAEAMEIIDEKELGVKLHEDYEITIEAEPEGQGGVNLDLTYDFYRFDELFVLLDEYHA